MAKMKDSGQAIIEKGSLVIRVSLEALPMVLEGAWAMGKFDTRYKRLPTPASSPKSLCTPSIERTSKARLRFMSYSTELSCM